MIIFIIILAVLVAALIWYALKGRAWLKTKTWAQPFFNWIEPIEIALYKKSETILFARLKMVVGVVLTVLTQIGTIDLVPILPIVPDKYQSVITTVFGLLPLTITLMGWIDEKLRNATTKPVEMVALPANAPVAATVAAAQAESATAAAVETIKAVTVDPAKA